MTRRAATLTLFAAALLLQIPAARTAPLDKEACNNLKTEQAQLEQAGARGNMGRGPLWAKANLEPDKLEQIRRLLEVDEQLLFRCHGKALVNLPKDSDPDPAAREPDDKDAAKQPAAKAGTAPKVQKKQTEKKAAAKRTEETAKGTAKPEAAPSKPEPKKTEKAAAAKKTKPKQKVDDAYRPPTSDASADPFAQQLAPKP